MKNLNVFLPQVATYQLQELGLVESEKSAFKIEPLQADWQSSFCSYIGVRNDDLPWTQLRMAQFELNDKIRTACCCDPVLMQMTHRGAYMLGQSSLSLTQNDAIRIVAQINERLMREGEHLYMVDKHAWLFTSQQPLQLETLAVKDLIGKDMFNYSYGGSDASYWQKLQTEIQMLIKEMIDYQGLPATSAESIMNVHFSDAVSADCPPEIPFIKNEALTILSDNELIKTFCLNSMLSNRSLNELASPQSKDVAVLAFESEIESYPAIIDFWLRQLTSNRLNECRLVCQDSCLMPRRSKGFIQRLFRWK